MNLAQQRTLEMLEEDADHAESNAESMWCLYRARVYLNCLDLLKPWQELPTDERATFDESVERLMKHAK